MPITLEDIRRERERRLANPAQTLAPVAQERPRGITLADIQAERARRAAGGFDPFNPPGSTGDPTREYRTDPQAEAVQEAFPTTLASGDVAGPTIGEVIGGGVGAMTGPAAPVAVPLLAAAGSGIGLVASRWLQGEPVTAQEVTGEALTSIIPEVITQGGRAVLRASKQAKAARFADLAQQARREAGEVFDPPEKALVSGLFDQVAESGVRVDTSSMQKFIGGLGPRYDDLVKEVRRIDNSLKTGGQFEDVITRMQAGQRGAFDIGRLQALRSELRKRAQTTNLPFEAKELIGDLEQAVDDSIFNGLARGQHAAEAESTRNTLKMARAGYAKLRRTEELQGIVENAITADKSGSGVTISLGRIKDTIRKGTGKAGKSIQRGFEHDPQAKQRFYDFLDRLGPQHDKINVSLADLPPQLLGQSIGLIGDWMATIYTSAAGREAFEQLVTSGQGKLTHSTLANLANVARRELEEQSEATRPSRPEQERQRQ